MISTNPSGIGGMAMGRIRPHDDDDDDDDDISTGRTAALCVGPVVTSLRASSSLSFWSGDGSRRGRGAGGREKEWILDFRLV
jgi:hypothetical protein